MGNYWYIFLVFIVVIYLRKKIRGFPCPVCKHTPTWIKKYEVIYGPMPYSSGMPTWSQARYFCPWCQSHWLINYRVPRDPDNPEIPQHEVIVEKRKS